MSLLNRFPSNARLSKSSRFRKEFSLPVLGFSFVLLLLVACRPSNAPTPLPSREATATLKPTSTPAPVTITFACGEYFIPVYQQLAEQFDDRSHIDVQIVALEDIVEMPFLQAQGSVEPWYDVTTAVDVAVWSVSPMVFQRGFFQDLTPFIDPDFDVGDFYPLYAFCLSMGQQDRGDPGMGLPTDGPLLRQAGL